jgi:hypothetical protein
MHFRFKEVNGKEIGSLGSPFGEIEGQIGFCLDVGESQIVVKMNPRLIV